MAVDGGDPPSAAVCSLFHLFKLTEVFLWDDGYDEGLTGSLESDSCLSTSARPVEDIALPFEDLELCKEMVTLGLPTSFRNNERGSKVRAKRARRSQHAKHEPAVSWDGITEPPTRNNETVVGLPDSCHPDAENPIGNARCVNKDYEAVLLQAESVFSESTGFPTTIRDNEIYVAPKVKVLNGNCSPEASLDSLITGPNFQISTIVNVGETEYCIEDPLREREIDVRDPLENSCFINANMRSNVVHAENEEHHFVSLHESSQASDGDQVDPDEVIVPGSTACWKAVWDDFYQRNYFYNVETLETTWNPPHVMEHIRWPDGSDELSNLVSGTDDATGGKSDLVKVSHEPNIGGVHNHCDSNDFLSVETCRISEMTVACGALSNCPYEDICGMEDNAGLLVAVPPDSCQGMEEFNVLIPNQDCTAAGDKFLHSTPCGMSSVVDDKLYSSEAILINAGSEDCSGNYIGELKFVKLVNDTPNPHLLPCHVNMKKKARARPHKKLSSDQERTEVPFPGTTEGCPANIMKYWCQRYSLFSRFDQGIKLDEEGWFSVTPECLAKHHASRCRCGTIIDCFTGVAGNAIQFAKKSRHVIAIDIDPQKIEYAVNNAHIYGIADKIDFIKADFFAIAPSLKADVVFLSPPWGGPDYSKVETYNMKTMLRPRDGYFLFGIARTIAPRIVMFLPRNVDLDQLIELSALADPCTLEVEKAYINGKLKGITAYFEIR